MTSVIIKHAVYSGLRKARGQGIYLACKMGAQNDLMVWMFGRRIGFTLCNPKGQACDMAEESYPNCKLLNQIILNWQGSGWGQHLRCFMSRLSLHLPFLVWVFPSGLPPKESSNARLHDKQEKNSDATHIFSCKYFLVQLKSPTKFL